MYLVEILGFLTGTVNVWLLARQNIWKIHQRAAYVSPADACLG